MKNAKLKGLKLRKRTKSWSLLQKSDEEMDIKKCREMLKL
jgi:hypothetical protein